MDLNSLNSLAGPVIDSINRIAYLIIGYLWINKLLPNNSFGEDDL